MSRTMTEHLQTLVARAVGDGDSSSVRMVESRTAAEAAHDLRDLYAAGQATLRVGRVADLIAGEAGDAEAEARTAMRSQLLELRDLDSTSYPGLLPTNVLNDGQLGYGPAPLVRVVAQEWTDALTGGAAIVPGFVEGGPFAEVDPVLPRDEGPGMEVVDVAAGDHRHYSILTVGTSGQLVKWLTPDGRALLDRIVEEEVDLAAEKFIAAELVAAAGGTRAAAGGLADAIDDAESAAGGRGLPAFVVVNAVDWPAVRRALASTYFEGPHPLALVSAGQPAGTATYVGQAALALYVNDIQRMAEARPRVFMTEIAAGRPFYLAIREAGLVQTVTGIGA